MTDNTTIRTITPKETPNRQIRVIMEKKVRNGFKYRNAKLKLIDRLNSFFMNNKHTLPYYECLSKPKTCPEKQNRTSIASNQSNPR